MQQPGNRTGKNGLNIRAPVAEGGGACESTYNDTTCGTEGIFGQRAVKEPAGREVDTYDSVALKRATE